MNKLTMVLDLLKHQTLVWLGVEEKLRQAFHEGFAMAHDTDPRLCASNAIHPDQVREIVRKTRTWRSAEEAWVNSDAQEPFDTPLEQRMIDLGNQLRGKKDE